MANTARLPWRDLWHVLPIDNLPFAYAALKAWTAVFGEAETALRGLSAVAYAAAAVMASVAARKAAGSGAAVAAGLFVAASDRVGLEMAATARPYALLACVAAAALLQSVTLLDDRALPPGSLRRRGLLLGLTHLIGMLTHPVYISVIGA